MGSVLLRGGGVLCLDDSFTYHHNGFVFIEDERISAVGAMTDRPPDEGIDLVLDTTGCVVTPGLINMHQHHWYCLLKGLSEGYYLEDWVAKVLFPATRSLRREDFIGSMKLAAAEMLLSGTTTFFNHSVVEVDSDTVDELAQVSAQTGIRQFFGKELRANPRHGASRHRTETEALLRRYPHGLAHLFSVNLAFESGEHWLASGATNIDLARYAITLGSEFKVPISDHITGGTGFRSVKDFRTREGCGEVEWLLRQGLLSPQTLLVHSVWIDDGEIQAAAAANATVVTCPSSSAFTAGGVAPLRAMAQAGLNIALGSDGPMVNDSTEMLTQMREAFLLSSAKYLTPAAITTRQLWQMATKHGARALGFTEELGFLAPGAVADLAVFDLSGPHYGGALNPPSNLILAGGPRTVKWLLVNGNIVVDPSGIVTFDAREAIDEARELARDLATRAGLVVH